jgi:hypothetical protein
MLKLIRFELLCKGRGVIYRYALAITALVLMLTKSDLLYLNGSDLAYLISRNDSIISVGILK